MPAHLRRIPAVLTAAAIALVLTGCATDSGPTPSTPTGGATETTVVSPPPDSAEPGPTEGVVDPADVTCENLIGEDLVTELTDQGWSAREDPFFIGDLELPDGISCTWGDFEATTGDDLLLFAWSEISDEEAATARASLTAEGWITEESSEGVYVTEDPSQAIALDADGYGVTYLFGEGWVTLSDTKQGLVLIERPGR